MRAECEPADQAVPLTGRSMQMINDAMCCGLRRVIQSLLGVALWEPCFILADRGTRVCGSHCICNCFLLEILCGCC